MLGKVETVQRGNLEKINCVYAPFFFSVFAVQYVDAMEWLETFVRWNKAALENVSVRGSHVWQLPREQRPATEENLLQVCQLGLRDLRLAVQTVAVCLEELQQEAA